MNLATESLPEQCAPPGLESSIALLLQASQYAELVQRGRWEFAVELSSLVQSGVTVTALRWLVHNGYLEHAVEHTPPGAAQREFRQVTNLTLPPGCCFVLTESGLHFARTLTDQRPARVPVGVGDRTKPSVPLETADLGRPEWRPELHQLWFGSLLVREFRRPAPHQEWVLAVFEEEGWPTQIDDPLPGTEDIDPKRRLHDTIVRLNRHQLNRLIVFRGDGSGKAIRWSRVEADSRPKAPR